MPPKLFYIGIKGLIKKENKILVLMNEKGSKKKYWDIPGGRMSEGEEIHQTLKRELGEELLSIQNIQIGEMVYVYKLPHNLIDGNGLMLQFYIVNADIKEVIISDEHQGYLWVGKEELVSLGNKEDDHYIEDGYKEAIKIALER
ncbi:MAG: NUDIX domain-containing protein [bacterium]|nr:NUDIX domain-containing protein [bacterium]